MSWVDWKEVGCEHEKTVSMCLLGSLRGLTMGTVWGICSFTLFLPWPALALTASGYCVMAVVMNCHTLVWESKSLAALLLPGAVVIHVSWIEKIATSSKFPLSRKFTLIRNIVNYMLHRTVFVYNTLYMLA